MTIMNMKRWMAAVAAGLLMLSMGFTLAEAASAVTLEDAKTIALQKAGFGEAAVFMTKLAEDREDGRRVFEIEFIIDGKEYEFDIDAEAGDVIKESTRTVSGRKSEMVAGNFLSMDDAKKKAAAHAGVSMDEAVFSEIEFDYDDGRAEYEMKFSADGRIYNVELNAETGDIIEYEMKSSGSKK